MELPTLQTKMMRVWRASGLAWLLPLLACFWLAIPARATIPSSDLPYLGPLDNFAEVGDQLNYNPATVNGNVGIFTDGKLKVTKPTKTSINGDVYLGTNATFTASNSVSGTVFSEQNLLEAQYLVYADSSVLASLTADDTITKNQTKALSFDVAPGQMEVVDLNGGLNLHNQNITLTGGGNLLLNIKGSFTLNGTASITGNPDDIYINYEGTRAISTHAHDVVDALVYDPGAAANLGGTWSGGIFGGAKPITLESGATVTQAPEPGSLTLISTALVSLLLARRCLRSMKNEFKEKRSNKT